MRSKKTKFTNALDIGCGNGWFTNHVAKHCDKITGLDINETELKQAHRLFSNESTSFVYGNIFEIDLSEKFDLVTFNASIQYFENIEYLMSRIKEFIAPNGEVHILDSPVYDSCNSKNAAKERSNGYYAALGEKEMASFYYHHDMNDLKKFTTMFTPRNKFISKIFSKDSSPFYWLRWINDEK